VKISQFFRKSPFDTGEIKEAESFVKCHTPSAIATGFQQKVSDDEWGILVVQDLIKSVLLSNRSAEDVHVYEIITKPVIPIPAKMDIRYAGRLNYRAGIRRAL